MADNPLSILQEVAQIPGLLKEIYGDLAKPGVSQVGKSLGAILGLGNTLLWPIVLFNERARIALEKNLEKYRSRLENVREEQIVEVRPELGVPILEKLGYVSDEELSDLFVNLLEKASIAESAQFAHPAFIAIINSLSPDEAALLKAMIPQEWRALRARCACIAAVLVNKESKEFRVAADFLTGLEDKAKLSFPGNVAVYLSNFEGLGLIAVRRDIIVAAPDAYKKLEEKYCPDESDNKIFGYDPAVWEWTFHKGKIEMTSFGRLFRRACFTKVKD